MPRISEDDPPRDAPSSGHGRACHVCQYLEQAPAGEVVATCRRCHQGVCLEHVRPQCALGVGPCPAYSFLGHLCASAVILCSLCAGSVGPGH